MGCLTTFVRLFLQRNVDPGQSLWGCTAHEGAKEHVPHSWAIPVVPAALSVLPVPSVVWRDSESAGPPAWQTTSLRAEERGRAGARN